MIYYIMHVCLHVWLSVWYITTCIEHAWFVLLYECMTIPLSCIFHCVHLWVMMTIMISHTLTCTITLLACMHSLSDVSAFHCTSVCTHYVTLCARSENWMSQFVGMRFSVNEIDVMTIQNKSVTLIEIERATCKTRISHYATLHIHTPSCTYVLLREYEWASSNPLSWQITHTHVFFMLFPRSQCFQTLHVSPTCVWVWLWVWHDCAEQASVGACLLWTGR